MERHFRAFLQANAATGTTRAERNAVLEFNRRVRGLNGQRSAVNAERTKLDLELR